MLGEVRIDGRETDRVKGQIPGGVPRVLPLVRHRNDVVVEHVEPVAVPDRDRRRRVERVHAVLTEPHVDVEEVVLLRPEEASECLSHDQRGVLAGGFRRQRSVELVRVATPASTSSRRRRNGRGPWRIGEAEPDRRGLASPDVEAVVSGGLGAGLCRVDGIGVPVHDERVKGVFDVGARVGRVEEPLPIRVVLGGEQWRRAIAVEPSIAKFRVRSRHDARAVTPFRRGQVGFLRAGPPVPRVPEPQGGQQMNRRGLRAPVRDGDANEAFLGR